MNNLKIFLFFGILLGLIGGCKFIADGDNEENNKPVETVLVGTVVYKDINDVQYSAIGARVSAYQNNQEKAYTIINSEDGGFQLTGLWVGIFDIIFTTDQNYQPTKIANFNIISG